MESNIAYEQKVLFIADHLKGSRPVVELCVEYGVSRKTAYKWIERYLHYGAAGLEDRLDDRAARQKPLPQRWSQR